MEDFPEIPGYQIASELGSGAVAIVYLGIQEKLERKVAIKVMEETTLQKNSHISKRFVREAKTAASLSHSNIIQIFDAGKEERYFYIVMEYLEESLRDRMMRSPKYKIVPDMALDIVGDMMRALDYAHLRGIYHRDIKPDNIMFRQDGTPVLLDFGIARIFDPPEDLTKSKMSMGTTYYMSPEQCRAQKDLDGRSDVYSLGVVLFEMLTGERPYRGDTPGIITSQHLDKPVPGLPEELSIYQPLIDKMMAKNREKRISSRPELMQLIADIPRDGTGFLPGVEESLPPEGKPPSFQNLDFTTSTSQTTPKSSIFNQIKEKFVLFINYPLRKKLVLGVLPLIVILFLILVLFPGLGQGFKKDDANTARENALNVNPDAPPGERLKQAEQYFKQGKEILEKLGNIPGVEELEEKIKQEKEKQFNTFLNNARLYYEGKDFLKAKEYIVLAKKIKETEEVITLENDIDNQIVKINNNEEQIKKDDHAYEEARSKNTIADYRKYLNEFPGGRHVEEATRKRKELTQSDPQQTIVNLRFQGETLDKSSAESMIKKYDFFDYIMNDLGNFEGGEYDRSIIVLSPVVIDQKTNLMWYDGDSSGEVTFNGAERWINKLNRDGYAGYRNWRLPTLEEAASLLKSKKNKSGMYIDAAFSGNLAAIWTSDRYNSNNMWVVSFKAGFSDGFREEKTTQVRPVRSYY